MTGFWSRKNQKGASIIELLVVVGIIIFVFSMIAISNFPKVRLQFSLSRVAYAFEQDVRRAQVMSASSVEYKNSDGQLKPVMGYGVYINISKNKQYTIYADAQSLHPYYDGLSDYTVSAIDISQTEPGIIIKQINGISGNDVSIDFAPPGPTTVITPAPNQGGIEVVFALASDPSITKTVFINTAGLIEVK